MGWASGSELAEQVWQLVERYVPSRQRKRVAKKLIALFEHHDADDFSGDQAICEAAGLYQDDADDEFGDWQ